MIFRSIHYEENLQHRRNVLLFVPFLLSFAPMSEDLQKDGIPPNEDTVMQQDPLPMVAFAVSSLAHELNREVFGVVKNPLKLAASLVSVVANRKIFPSQATMDNLHHWSNGCGIVCASSHQERVAAILQSHIALADELAEQYATEKPYLKLQALRDKARHSAARAVWFWDPTTGDLETFLRQDIALGLEYYDKHGSWGLAKSIRAGTFL